MKEHNEPLEENVDQLTQWRERCADHVSDLKSMLDECNDRVNSRTNTEETCHQVLSCVQKCHLCMCKYMKEWGNGSSRTNERLKRNYCTENSTTAMTLITHRNALPTFKPVYRFYMLNSPVEFSHVEREDRGIKCFTYNRVL
ncbi:unnamed protein product [Haemonchus placei]|uniref:UCR_hinge domain-containing protein n=1 Tax=Haemonchus placei TaxID=6290 RepID=A0A0N4W4D3_HAEPC|nr:unnamed protein product [Haemonchus placei]